MKTRFRILARILLLLCTAAPVLASPVSIGFSDLGCMTTIPASYDGLTWSQNLQIECNGDYMSTYGNTYGSDTGYAATNGGAPGFGFSEISIGAGTFDFLSASFTAFAGNNMFQPYSAESLIIYGFAPGDSPDNPSFGALIDLDPTQYLTTTLNFTGIDELVIAAGTGPSSDPATIFGVDGLSWLMTDVQIVTVPEPASIGLLVAWLIAIALWRRTSTQHSKY